MNFSHQIEALENRIAPAGVVLVEYDSATGALTLTGDDAENVLDVFRTGPASVRLEGFDGTTFEKTSNPGTFFDFIDFAKVTSLTIDMKGGVDDLILTNLTLKAADIGLGSGSDFLTLNNVTVKGAAEIDFGTDGGDATIEGVVSSFASLTTTSASGDSSLSLEALTTIIKGSLTVNGSAGTDSLSNGGTGSLTIGKGLIVNFGDGDNSVSLSGRGTLKIGKSATGQSVDYNGGANQDQLSLQSSSVTLGGFIDFEGGDGSNFVNFLAANGVGKIGKSSTGASIRFVGGTDTDSLNFDGGNAALAGGIDFDGGDSGFNSVEIDHDGALRVGKLKATGNSVNFVGGIDEDELFLGGSILALAGGISMKGGAGENTVDLDGENVALGFGTTGDSISFDNEGGIGTLDLEGGRVTLKGNIFFVGDDGADNVDLTDIGVFTAREIFFDGLGGNDFFDLGAELLRVNGTVEVFGAAGNDDIRIFADGQFKKDVTLDLEDGDTDQFVSVISETGLPGGLQFLGKLTIGSTGSALSNDFATLENIVVGKDLNIELGDGASSVVIDNLIARGPLAIRTNGGSDSVEFERDGLFGPSIVSKVASIELGDGDDVLEIGDSLIPALAAHNRVRFLAAVTLNGGGGSNTVNDDLEDANVFAVDPILTSFV